MIIPTEQLHNLFKKIYQIREESNAYLIAGDQIRFRVEDLHRLVERMYDLRIKKFTVATSGRFAHSTVKRYKDGSAVILVRHNLGDPEKRLCVVKELCHLVLDEPEDWSVEGQETIRRLVRIRTLDLDKNNDHRPDSRITICEILAEFAATELLYPFEFRAADIEAIAAGESSDAKLALKYEVPIRTIRLALDPTNHTLCSNFHNKMQAGKN